MLAIDDRKIFCLQITHKAVVRIGNRDVHQYQIDVSLERQPKRVVAGWGRAGKNVDFVLKALRESHLGIAHDNNSTQSPDQQP